MNLLPTLETERLIIRPITLDDVQGFFEMDSQPEVHTFLRGEPLKSLAETHQIIESIIAQYQKFGIGRVGVIEKSTNIFIGWTGFKFIAEEDTINNRFDFLDFGYRFRKEVWGRGYATEAAKACMEFYKNNLTQYQINAITHIDNLASRRILEKVGFEVTETFQLKMWDITCYWYELNK